MPTFDIPEQFLRDWVRLTPEQQAAFRKARDEFVEDLRAGKGFRAGLRVKGVQGKRNKGVFELTWAPNGRATWQYGPEQRQGHSHVIWRRVGDHGIFTQP
ncbi:MAG TPA: hypothetical protein VFM55_14900 [Micromonosporaceae bacterium]|nr:hypothetical protein [Micromonosporaceae bacterium]